jgi:hypothetical protein
VCVFSMAPAATFFPYCSRAPGVEIALLLFTHVQQPLLLPPSRQTSVLGEKERKREREREREKKKKKKERERASERERDGSNYLLLPFNLYL